MTKPLDKAITAARHPVRAAKYVSRFVGTSRCCYVCRKTFGAFEPYRNGLESVAPFLQALRSGGSDVVNFACPYCHCHDRERHLWMYFDKLEIWPKLSGASVIHFAPEQNLAAKIHSCGPRIYVKGDLFPSSPEFEKIDVTRIQYPQDHFDFVICNHVLEHVPDDRQALSELFRILKPGGSAILQTPYSSVLTNSFSDPSIDTDELRYLCYGQEDHVRIYGRDLFARIEQVGFVLQPVTHQGCLSDVDAAYFGVNPIENLILARKP